MAFHLQNISFTVIKIGRLSQYRVPISLVYLYLDHAKAIDREILLQRGSNMKKKKT